MPKSQEPKALVEDEDENENDENDKRVTRQVDLTLIPWLCLIYLFAFLDRSNIGNAKVDGLSRSMHLSTKRFNATLTIFFVSYSIFEPLSNIFLKRFSPPIFISSIMIIWGLCMTFMGFAKNWSGLMAARWFLGLSEAGLFPGIAFYLSCWYTRSEIGIRTAIFFSSAAVSGSFGGLLAAGISQMDGLGGHPGWAWLFILEGSITIILGIASFWAIKDFPHRAKFLSPAKRTRFINRLNSDKQSLGERGSQNETFQMKYLWIAVSDYKTWISMGIYSGILMPLYAFSLFLPSIINQLGYSPNASQLLSVPPYVAATFLTIFIGWYGDRTRQRGFCNIFISFLGIVGFVMLLASSKPRVKYAGTFLGALGIYPCAPNTLSWIANNTEGEYKRGIVLGFVIGWGNLSGIVSSNVYFNAPDYSAGHATVIAFMSVFLLAGSVLLRQLLQRENRLRTNGERDKWVIGLSPDSLKDLGDKRPDFLYTL